MLSAVFLFTIFPGDLCAISVICTSFDGDHARGILEFGNYSNFNMQVLLGTLQTRSYYDTISNIEQAKERGAQNNSISDNPERDKRYDIGMRRSSHHIGLAFGV